MNPDTRPEWIRCIRRDHADFTDVNNRHVGTWCGRRTYPNFEIVWTLDHVASLAYAGSRFQACFACVEKAVAALKDAQGPEIEPEDKPDGT